MEFFEPDYTNEMQPRRLVEIACLLAGQDIQAGLWNIDVMQEAHANAIDPGGLWTRMAEGVTAQGMVVQVMYHSNDAPYYLSEVRMAEEPILDYHLSTFPLERVHEPGLADSITFWQGSRVQPQGGKNGAHTSDIREINFSRHKLMLDLSGERSFIDDERLYLFEAIGLSALSDVRLRRRALVAAETRNLRHAIKKARQATFEHDGKDDDDDKLYGLLQQIVEIAKANPEQLDERDTIINPVKARHVAEKLRPIYTAAMDKNNTTMQCRNSRVRINREIAARVQQYDVAPWA